MSFPLSQRLLEADRVRAVLRKIEECGGAWASADAKAGSQSGAPPDIRVNLPDGCVLDAWLPAGWLPAVNGLQTALEQVLAGEYENIDLTRELSLIYEELTLLYRLSESFTGTLQLDELQKRAVAEIAATLEVKRASVLMLSDDGECLVLTAGLGVTTGDVGKRRFARGHGLAWNVIETGRPLIVNEPAKHPAYEPGLIPDESLLLAPLPSKTGWIGVLVVSSKLDGGEFSSKDEKLLATIAQQMGSVWENARLYRETRELFLNTVEALAAAIDAKDPYTHGHSRRVTDFSVATAARLGVAGDDLETIRVSALLHDIGKLGVSEAVLRKPDRLTADEYAEIKKHPVIGAEIMQHIRKLSKFIPGMIDHHERFDGSGYPDGRRGDAISLAGRIIAVADTFDAITSSRPYHPDRRGRPAEAAVAEIRRCSGMHYDPAVVEGFLRAWDAGEIKPEESAAVAPADQPPAN
ncbi:MAG TPA: HD domain-containing protein [Candidatus Ozemobacteraceae bacterium]|nr:HD domain-containing protein [Candidatus Ozemobacteraceae bacterium]